MSSARNDSGTKGPATLSRIVRTQYWLFTLLVIVPLAAHPVPKESVHDELVRLQAQTGLTFAWNHDGVHAVWFERRTSILLKNSGQAFQPDGFSSGERWGASAIDSCWSHDKSKLASTMIKSGKASLEVLDLKSKLTRDVIPHVEPEPHVTSQCWSPDDAELVYEIEGSIGIYKTSKNTSKSLVNGADPTWSPDGDWIAFLDRDTYYAMRPDGTGRKKLFHQSGVTSALYWSPDARIVAYVRQLGFLQGGGLDAEANQLRVRRLDDGSEDRLCSDSVDAIDNYQWITSSELINRKSETPRSK
jgi:hypothetical protein